MLGHRAIGEGPLQSLLDTTVTQTQTFTFRFATQSFATRSTDSPAHYHMEGRIRRGLTLSRRLTAGQGGQFGSLIETDFGEIQLVNNDGFLDSLLNKFHTDGRQIRLKIGATEINQFGREKVKPYVNFALVYTAIAGGWSFEHDTVKLRISDLSHRLNDRLQRQTYAGTGGKQGTADMLGRTLPTSFGRNLNITAQLVDPGILTYQVHSSKIDSISAVYDAGVVVPFGGVDYATYEQLVAASPSPATYVTCLAEGFFRLASTPLGDVTADIRGHRTFVGDLYSDEHGGIMEIILLDYSDLTEEDIDTLSFDVLDGIQSDSMGIFLPSGDTSTVRDVLNQIASSCGAFIGQDRSGLIRTMRLDAPKTDPDWTFTDRDILRNSSGEARIERLDLPYGVPWKSIGLGYQKNWTIQKRLELAGDVSENRRRFLESEYRFVYTQSTEIARAHLTSAGIIKTSLFSARSSAENEVNRLIKLYSLGRSMYRVSVKTSLFSVELGQTVRLIYDRWDLAGGQNFVAVGVYDNADTTETELILFGGGDTISYAYDIKEAMRAKRDNNLSYFQNELPSASLSTGIVTDAPSPPSQRGWTELTYPALQSSQIGLLAKNVLVAPAYPLDAAWSDSLSATFVGQAPDSSLAIEIRYAPGQVPQAVDAYIPFITAVQLPGVQGSRHVGCKLEVWTQAGFNWGALFSGGKVAGGLWGGRRPATGLATPVQQGGISARNIWGVGSLGVNARGYSYILNRPEADGAKTPSIPNKWATGQWQRLEYEGFINTPGFADGYVRMWLGNECISEITGCIWAVANEFLWRGIIISDAWQDGNPPQAQKRWIRNLTVYVPPA